MQVGTDESAAVRKAHAAARGLPHLVSRTPPFSAQVSSSGTSTSIRPCPSNTRIIKNLNCANPRCSELAHHAARLLPPPRSAAAAPPSPARPQNTNPLCRQLLSEQEVQARAADAARANVEAHYLYILSTHRSFMERFGAQHAAHGELLGRLEEDASLLAAIELPPQLQQPGRWRCLLDVSPAAPRLGEWRAQLGASHAHVGAKVAEVEAGFDALRRDVEALFMQAPRVDLDALWQQLVEAEGQAEEQAAAIAALSADLDAVCALVEDVVRRLPGAAAAPGGAGALMASPAPPAAARFYAPAAASTTTTTAAAAGNAPAAAPPATLQDALLALDAAHDAHCSQLLPRVADCDAVIGAFAEQCAECKASMTADVMSQLQVRV